MMTAHKVVLILIGCVSIGILVPDLGAGRSLAVTGAMASLWMATMFILSERQR